MIVPSLESKVVDGIRGLCHPHLHVMRSAEINRSSCEMLTQIFRNACEGYGTYCPKKNEMRVHMHRKVYRFRCGRGELRLVAPGCKQVVLYIAPDATALEFRQGFDYLIDSHQALGQGRETSDQS